MTQRLWMSGLLALLLPSQGLAQPAAARPQWSIEFYGGASALAQSATGTTIGEFPVGETFTTTSGTASRFVSTWRFGDGATLFNTVAAQFAAISGQVIPPIVALDGVLKSPGARPGGGATLGVRLGRRLTRAWSVEVSLERHTGGLSLDDTLADSLESARVSFAAAFTALLQSAPATGLSVSSTMDRPDSRNTHTRVLAQVTRTLIERGRWTLLGSAGGGLQLVGGEAAEVVLLGRYSLLPFNQGQLAQSDDVRITFTEEGSSWVGLASLGVTWDLNARTAIRLDGRLSAYANHAVTRVRTAPATNTNPSVQPLTTVTSPGLQFTTQASPRSTLDSGAGRTITTFTGSGLNRHSVITLGIVARF